MNAEEFERGYADRSMFDVADLRKHRVVRPCNCGDELCLGWAMVPLEYDAEEIEDRLRDMHRARIATSGVEWLPFDREHEYDVIRRALETIYGGEAAPELHSHALEELGLCTECDAAAILEDLTAEEVARFRRDDVAVLVGGRFSP